MEQVITIPKYVTSIKISNSRRPTYYKEGSVIPKKYSDINRYEFRIKKFRNYNKRLLYDKQEKQFVIKNEAFVGTPRMMPIGGNAAYSGLNEHVRMKMVSEIKNSFRSQVLTLTPITQFPIQIDAQIHCLPKLRNWDIDNLWIYIKSFQDLLIESEIIPDDSVRYITKAPSFEYFPVMEEDERKMVFILRSDIRNITTTHIMFKNGKTPIVRVKGQYRSIEPVIHLSIADISSGTALLEKDSNHYKISIGVGKRKLIYDKLRDALKTARYWAFQYNASIVIDSNMGTEYPNYSQTVFMNVIENCLSDIGIPVIIHNL